jgi:hypothetical protein
MATDLQVRKPQRQGTALGGSIVEIVEYIYKMRKRKKRKNLTRNALGQTSCSRSRNGKHPVAKGACHRRYMFIYTYDNISKIVCATVSYQKGYCFYFDLGTVIYRTQKT